MLFPRREPWRISEPVARAEPRLPGMGCWRCWQNGRGGLGGILEVVSGQRRRRGAARAAQPPSQKVAWRPRSSHWPAPTAGMESASAPYLRPPPHCWASLPNATSPACAFFSSLSLSNRRKQNQTPSSVSPAGTRSQNAMTSGRPPFTGLYALNLSFLLGALGRGPCLVLIIETHSRAFLNRRVALPEMCWQPPTPTPTPTGSCLSCCFCDFQPSRTPFSSLPTDSCNARPCFLLSCASEHSRAVPFHSLCPSSLCSYSRA